MKDSCPDLLLLEMPHAHTTINYSSAEARGLLAGTRGRGWCQARAVVPGQDLCRAAGRPTKVWRAVVLGTVELMLHFEQVFAVCFAWFGADVYPVGKAGAGWQRGHLLQVFFLFMPHLHWPPFSVLGP